VARKPACFNALRILFVLLEGPSSKVRPTYPLGQLASAAVAEGSGGIANMEPRRATDITALNNLDLNINTPPNVFGLHNICFVSIWCCNCQDSDSSSQHFDIPLAMKRFQNKKANFLSLDVIYETSG
jgi:hypothetical protein